MKGTKQMAISNPALWRPNTRQWVIAESLIANGFNRSIPRGGKGSAWHRIRVAVRGALDPMLKAQIEPMVFKGDRPDGSYGPLDPNTQGKRLWYAIADVMKAIADYGWDREAGIAAAAEETQIEDPGCGGCENGECCGYCPCCPDPAAGTFDTAAELKLYVAEVRRIRNWLAVNDPEGEIDHISYRPIKDGRRMIEIGQIPAKACLHAMTMHWERADRERAGIENYDPARDFPGGLHAYLDALVKAGVLIMLTGPAGMGKSYWTETLTERRHGSDWKRHRALIPCSEGISPSWFLGKDLRSGYAEAKFQRIWREGGVILMDEMDRSDSNILTLINDALANDVLDNPVERAEHDRHPDCVIVAATNTLGFGADDKYVGANELDFSTIDRFRMGRAYVGYDADVEDLIAFG